MKTKTYVRPEGDPKKAIIAIVGEQPGRTEIQNQRPFVGPAGRELNENLQAISLARHDCYLTNFAKDLDNHVSKYLNTKSMTYSEIGLWHRENLIKELNELKTNVIVVCGNYALAALTAKTGITKWRGSILDCPEIPDKWIIPCLHPATVIPPKFQFLNKFLIQFDLRRALWIAKGDYKAKTRNLITRPSFQGSLMYLKRMFVSGLAGKIIYFDIEIYNEEVSCISFTDCDNEAISIPFIENKNNYFLPDQELTVMIEIANILENPKITKCGQNVGFDSHFLLRRYGIKAVNLEDTMVAQRIIMPDYPMGLDFITSIWTDQNYYKDEGKKYFGGGGWPQLWKYNATDSLMCAEALPKQIKRLGQQKNIKTYERQRDIIPPLVYMQERGILCDVKGMIDENKQLTEELDVVRKKLNKTAGQELNANSPQQLSKYFYGALGYKAYTNRKTKRPTTDDLAMTRLARKGVKEAVLVQKIRKIRKIMGTYLPVIDGKLKKIDKDNRVRSSFNPAGTKFSRISSSENIFGTGLNLQNIPHSLLKFFLIDPGYIGYAIDLSQAENRIVAYVGNIQSMIMAFEGDIDIHSLTASLIFQKPIEDITSEYDIEHGIAEPCSLGDGTHDERFWGKKGNHCRLDTCEVLTKTGWIGIKDAYIEDLSIAQWDKTDGNISFIKPVDWSIRKYTGTIHRIENQRIFQEATPEHRMPLRYKDKIIDKTIDNFPHSGKYSSPLSGKYSDGLYTLPDCAIRLLVAFQADGSWNHRTMRFKLHKERKINRLKNILDTGNITYTNPAHGYFSISANFSVVNFARKFMGSKKLFGPWLLDLSQETLSTFIDELPYWDGYRKRNQYFTSIKQNAEWVQTIAHLCNRATNIREQDNSKTDAFGNNIIYITEIRSTIAPATSAINRTTRYVNDEFIFCPTVNSGYFMSRENGKISVSGNSLNYDLGFRSFALLYQMTEPQAKFVVERYHMAYPGVRNTYHALVRQLLRNGRTITNLMGRKTLFMDRWGDKLFKEAYSCIPQGTVGDIINEHGLNYIYYNEELFSSVELLLQKHDEIIFQIPKSLPLTKHAEIITKIKNKLETPLTTFDDRSFIIPADISVLTKTFSKRDCVEIKSKDVSNNLIELAKKLRNITDAEK